MATLHDDDDDDNVAAVPAKDGADVEVENDTKAAKEPEVEVIEDDGADERIAQSDEHDDATPRRQKESASERRARAKLAKERDKKELDFQRRELARQDALIKDLQKGQIVSRVTDLDTRIATAQKEADQFDRIFGQAISKQNGEDARTAAQLRDDAKNRAWQADQEKQQLIQQANRQPVKAPPYQGMAEQFMADNPWYDHDGKDEDSRLVKEIDAAVAKEYVPTSEAYWKELQRRVQKHLPQHFESEEGDDGEAQPVRKRGGPPTGGSSRGNSSTSTAIRLSPERVAAMKEAGAWEDPVLRARLAKRYAEYDKQKSRG